jgi:general stress protein 26
MTKEFLHDFISKQKYAVLSTATQNNSPESALIGFAVSPDLKIIFDTVISSRKYQNLISNSSVSLVIGWENERTVQYEGIAKLPSAKELDELLKYYFDVFPEGRKGRLANKVLAYVCVEPKWIRYCDFNLPQIIEERMF